MTERHSTTDRQDEISGAERLASLFEHARAEDRAVLLPYLTAGLPTIEDSVDLFEAMADAGADGFEIGIPYADPLMDGPVIMEAGNRALSQGVTVDRSLDVVREVVARTGKPVLVMTYVNPVLRNGVAEFFAKVDDSGASGVILADLPADESGPFVEAARATGLGMVLFVAPTTGEDRLETVVAADPAFIYGIAEVGVTGERTETSGSTAELARRVRAISDLPLVYGVGISRPDQVRAAAATGDGVIVGTAIVRRVLDADTAAGAAAELRTYVGELARSVRRS
jgi:tryptophan synthase alpha chain